MKLLPGTAPGGAIVKAKTTTISPDKLVPKKGKFLEAKVKLIEVNKILKDSLAAEKKEESDKNKRERAAARDKREKKLEKKDKKDDKDNKKLSLPPVPFFDRIKNFFVNTLLGFVLTRLVDETGKINPIVPLIGNTIEGAIDLTLGVLDGLGTFLKAGYGLIDSTKEWVTEKYGEEGLKKFDSFLAGVRNLFNAALIVAAAQMAFKPDRRDRGRKPGTKPGKGGGPRRPPTPADKVRNARIRNIQRKFGPGARRIYENALNNGKTPSQAKAAVDRALKKGQIIKRPGADSLASRTASKGRIAKGGLRKVPGRLATKFLGKAGLKAVKGIFGKIPIIGPLIVAVSSLLAGEPPAKALMKGLGAAVGGLLGTLIPIPVIGTLLGEAVGVFVGDLLYELIRPGGGPKAVGEKFVQSMKAIFEGGKAVTAFIGDGFKRFIKGFFKENPIQLPEGGGIRTVATEVATRLGMYDFLKDVGYAGGKKIGRFGLEDKKDGKAQIDKFPNILQLYNPFSFIPLLLKSFFPPAKNPPPESDEGFNFTKFFFGEDANTAGGDLTGSGRRDSSASGVRGSNIRAIGKSLGSKGFAVAEHPDFTKDTSGGRYTPGQGSVSNVHRGRGHYEGRAIDVTDFRGSMEDSKARYRTVLDELYANRANNNIKMLIHDSWGDYYYPNASKGGPASLGHPEHMHIEVKDRGGMIGKGMFMNKGKPEFVLDADSTKALEDNFPGFLHALNKADYSGALKVLRNYANYEQGGVQFIPVPIPAKSPETSNQMSTLAASQSSGSGNDWSKILYATG